ncbi:hypothetical protein HNR77_002187 [Paenibacillus sp. JGP012]|uniref:O-antigen ligase family protein n=1 Tax=Paenibacillus sp. JGP012 TaxID=2735914 RepID=UPI0016229FC9|nr:O-antigen ligase family protein [Paenibacillus sp. JGP012]MBB6021106.1 hypothetical protein [Paenibacillus sp. JGP012]
MKSVNVKIDKAVREAGATGDYDGTGAGNEAETDYKKQVNAAREKGREEHDHRYLLPGSSEHAEYGCYLQGKHNTYNGTAGPQQLWSSSSKGPVTEWAGIEQKKRDWHRTGSKYTTIIGLSMVVILLAGCLRRGLFNAADMYPVIVMTGVIVALSLVMYSRGARMPEQAEPGFVRSESMHLCRAGLLLVAFPSAMMLCYAAHVWAGSASTQGSMHEMLRWSLLAMFALLAAMLAVSPGGVRWLACGWQLAGGVLVLSGLLAVCGVLPLPYGVMRTADPEISSAGARLGGLLQYPNAYGAIVGMYALERLTAATGVLAGRAVPARRLFAAVLPLMPAHAALLLSESRGALLATGCAAVAAFAQQRRGARVPLLLALAAPLACAAWLYRQLAAAQLAPAPVPGLLAVAGAWAAALLGTLLLCRLWHSGARKGRAAAMAALVLECIAAALMAAASTADRFAAGVGTGTSRLQMWLDALQLWSEAAWLGRGGDTWRTMFRAIQSSPYVGGEVHSGLLDLALDTGLLGIALLAGWMLLTLRSIRRFAPRLLPPVLVFVLHGAVDFDWSFAFAWMLVIWLAAWAAALKAEADFMSPQPFTKHNSTEASPVSAANLIQVSAYGAAGYAPALKRVSQLYPSRRYSSRSPERSIAPGFTCIDVCSHACSYIYTCIHTAFSHRKSGQSKRYALLLLLACWLGGTVCMTALHTWAELEYRQAREEWVSKETRYEHLRAAYRLDPARTDVAIALARTLSYQAATAVLLKSLSYAPHDFQLYSELGRLAALTGNGYQAGHYWTKSIALNRYDYQTQSAALYWMEQTAAREVRQGRTEQARQTAAIGVQIYDRYQKLAVQVNAEHMRNDRRFLLQASAVTTGENLRRMAAGSFGRPLDLANKLK